MSSFKRGRPGMRTAACALLASALLGTLRVWAQGGAAEDPFAKSQQETTPALGAAPAAASFTLRGFIDAGYINITQTRPSAAGGNISWAYGNSQFTFFSTVDTFTVNEFALILQAEREYEGRLIGGTASVAFYPSRNPDVYGGTSADRPYQVDQAFVFVEFIRAWNTRVMLGRAPGFLTLEQQEGRPPDLSIIGHTYVYLAGGGYPYGLQVHTHPGKPLTLKFGVSEGGVGDYSFYPADRSTTDLSVSNSRDPKDNPANKPTGKTVSAAIDWVVFDRPAGLGTLRVGGGSATNPSMTYNPVKDRAEPYSFSNAYVGYQVRDFNLRVESAALRAYYTSSLGLFDATMYSVLLGYELGANHLFTLRNEGISYVTDLDATKRGQATKNGLTYRYRVAPPLVVKFEYVTEEQSPQFWRIVDRQKLTTNVAALSAVYSF